MWAPHVWVFVCVWPNEEDPRWCLGPLHICSLLKVSPIASTQCHQSPKFKPRSCVSLSLTQSLCHPSLTLTVTCRFPIQTEKHFYSVSPCVVWCQTMKKVEDIFIHHRSICPGQLDSMSIKEWIANCSRSRTGWNLKFVLVAHSLDIDSEQLRGAGERGITGQQ